MVCSFSRFSGPIKIYMVNICSLERDRNLNTFAYSTFENVMNENMKLPFTRLLWIRLDGSCPLFTRQVIHNFTIHLAL